MSQRFLNLIRKGETAEVASAVKEDNSLAACRDGQGISALLWSVYNHQPLIRDFLLSQLAEIDVFEASAAGDCVRLESLLRQDALLAYQTSSDGWPPLHLAAAFGGPQATALLLDHGAHIHRFSRNPVHNQALHACLASSRDMETVRLLMAQGADVNAVQAGGYTPLHLAAAAGERELVLLLLQSGADPGKPCDQAKTPADYARERNHAEIIPLLAMPANHTAV